MPNMSYCRFENTSHDLQDCYDHWKEDEDPNEYEKRGKENILELCRMIIEDYGDEEWKNTEREFKSKY